MAKTILIVEDDTTFALMLQTWLTKKGFIVHTAGNCANARKILEKENTDLVISDLRLPDNDGTTLLHHLRKHNSPVPVIIMTGYADVQGAVNAMKSGAHDYISKPVRPDELLKKIEEALSATGIPSIHQSKEDTPRKPHPDYMEGISEAARQLYNHAGLVAPTPMSVLINGASGTGKEYVAKRIHRLSKRAASPFIAIDCGAIPKELAASEFFGHTKGSFTGATGDKTGAFVEAHGGTLFLDEIGNLSYEVQVQLLRAIQERRIRPIGSTKEIEVDVRIISATNENLEAAIERGTFREDLFHRLNEFTIYMPTLKERREDIPLFANFFLDQANTELEREVAGFTPEANERLCTYPWPGNLRQLKNTVKRATLLAQGKYITVADLNLQPTSASISTAQEQKPLFDKENERQRIIEALQQTGNNKSKAAQLLKIDRKTLYNKLKIYNIE